MKRWIFGPALVMVFGLVLVLAPAGRSEERAKEKTAAERGREALLMRAFNPPHWSFDAYDKIWKQWGVKEKPADYKQAVMERYGLHAAPYDNGDFPMGLRPATGLFIKGVGNDCLLCHAGSIMGQSYIGLGNASLDIQTLYDELAVADGMERGSPFPFSNVRGTTEAAAVAILLLSMRDADLKVQTPVDLDIRHDMCEDAPAWWLLKKKKTMYHTGSTPARSVRTLMQFMLSPLNGPEYVKKQEPVFADIQAYLLTLEPPKCPLPIDEALAERGQALFEQNCSKCHGTYGPEGSYPNKIIPIDVIATDRNRFEGISRKAGEHYLKSWFAQEKNSDGSPLYEKPEIVGYQAPPLDGIWATAPYFHNGAAPTVYHVLNSKARPKIYTRSFRTGKEDYDPVRLGWKITVLEKGADASQPAIERRMIYDTTQPGRNNGGHTFGDKLTDEERMAVIEYLKKL